MRRFKPSSDLPPFSRLAVDMIDCAALIRELHKGKLSGVGDFERRRLATVKVLTPELPVE